MKAKETRKLAKEAVQEEINGIDSHIDIEAKRGHTKIVINGVSQGAIAYLKDEGYEVGEISIGEKFSQVIVQW